MAKQNGIAIRRVERLEGLAEAAQRLGCSRAHLSRVVRGLRQSRRLVEAMKRANIRMEVAR